MEGPTIAPRCWTGYHLSAVLLAIISPFTLQETRSIVCHESILSRPSISLQLSLLNPLLSEPFDRPRGIVGQLPKLSHGSSPSS